MSRRLGALTECGSEPLDAAARERVQRWRSRARRRAAMWIIATPLLPVAMFILVAALFRMGFEPLKVASTILGIVTVLFVFPAALLSARDGWVRSRRLSRDLREDRVELWAEAADEPPVRRLPHSGWLLDAPGRRRRRLERERPVEVADVPEAAFWIAIPADQVSPGAPPLDRRRLGGEEASELRAHVSSRMRGLGFLSVLMVLLLIPQLAPLSGARAWSGRLLYLVPLAWLCWRSFHLARFTFRLRRDAGLGYLVAPASDRRNEYLAASGIEWTVDGSPARWRL